RPSARLLTRVCGGTRDQLRGLGGTDAVSGTTGSFFFASAGLGGSFFGATALAGVLLGGLAAVLAGGGGGGGGVARFFCCSRSVNRSVSSFFCSSELKGLASRVGRDS